MKRLFALLSLALIMIAGTAYAEDSNAGKPDAGKEKTRRVAMGLTVGAFNPTNSEVRDLFGDTAIRIGFRPLPIDLKPRWTPAFDLGYYSLSNELDDDATLIPITGGVIKSLGTSKKSRSYVAVNAGTFYGDVNAASIGEDQKGWGFNTNATLGVIMNNSWSIEGRYDYFSEFAGLDFSAFTVSASLKFSTIKF